MRASPFILQLRWILPALLIIFGLLINIYTIFFSIPNANRQTEKEIESYLAESLNRMQGTLQYLYLRKLLDGVIREVSNLGGIEGYRILLLLDEQNNVLATNRYAFLQQNLSTISKEIKIDSSQLQKSKSTLMSNMFWSEEKNILYGYYPIAIGLGEHSLRPDKIGLLYVEFDASFRKDRVANFLVDQSTKVSILSTALLVILLTFLHFGVTRRVNHIVATTKRVSEGDFTRHVNLDGHDELASISNAFDQMVDRIATEQLQLQASEKRSRAILDNATDAIITINQHREILSFNLAAESMLGYSADAVIGKNVKMLMPDPHHTSHDAYVEHYLQTREAKIIGKTREVEAQHKNGNHISVELSVASIDVGGELIFIGMLHDLTERKRLDRLKNEFISVVSHELRTPLTSIRGALGLLVGNVAGDLGEKAKMLLTLASNNAERLSQLVNDLLDMQKMEAGKLPLNFQVSSLLPLLEQAIASNHSYAERFKVTLELQHEAGDKSINIDPLRFQQVLSNLLSNACKFSSAGGKVTIRTQNTNDQHVEIEVIDRGTGIPADFRHKVFEKFCQADSSSTRAKEGTGLGLSITKELVQQMNGTIQFESKVGEGTSFLMSFPTQ